MIKPQNISGFADYTEAQNYALSAWIKIIETNYRLYGFNRLTPRPAELKKVLLTNGGIEKQIFAISRLQNDLPTDMALPFDRTIPLAYWVAKHSMEIIFPYKRYDIGYSFRGERAQAGRFQGFFQADVDIVGKDVLSLSADADCITTVFDTIEKLQIGEPFLCLNHIGLVKEILFFCNVHSSQVNEVLNILDDIPKAPIRDITDKLTAILQDTVVDQLLTIFCFQGGMDDFFDATGCSCTSLIEKYFNELKFIYATLLDSGIHEDQILFKPCIVRGLNYYTGCVFETFIKGFENIGSVASGGRYNDLASSFTRDKLPGVGGSIGLTRLFDIACKNNLIKAGRCTESDIFIGYKDLSNMHQSTIAAKHLRSKNINCDLYSGKGNMKKQMIYADKKGFPYALIAMGNDTWIMKNLVEKIQFDVKSLNDIVQVFQSNT